MRTGTVNRPHGFFLGVVLVLLTLSYSRLSVAASINLLPGDTSHVGYGSEYPQANYFGQTFVALDEPLNAVVAPVAGPTRFRVLVTETAEDHVRPTNVLYESDDIILSGIGTNRTEATFYAPSNFNPDSFMFEDVYPGGTFMFLGASDTPGSRADHFALPLAGDVASGYDVWRTATIIDLAIWLGFGSDTVATFSEPLISFPGYSPVAVAVDVGGLQLTAGQTYAVIFDAAIFGTVPEPASLVLMFIAGLAACPSRRRR